MDILFLLFDGFQTLDAYGPAEVFSHVDEFNLHYCSLLGKQIKCSSSSLIETEILTKRIPSNSALFVPGGMATRALVKDSDFIESLQQTASKTDYCLTVCTGSALLSKTGLLDKRKATSNKKAWTWVTTVNDQVNWQPKARWCVDDHFYTSSGISAGIDMALSFVADRFSRERAIEIANFMEYHWNEDPHDDPFEVILS